MEIIFPSYTYDLTNTLQYNMMELKQISSTNSENFERIYGVKSKPCSKYFWNEFLLRDVGKKLSYPWIINLIHGTKIRFTSKKVWIRKKTHRSYFTKVI